MAENHFQGNPFILIDGSCGSTNGHFCSLLKYHQIGKFIGTPGGSSYKCNAGNDTEFILPNSKILITIGRTTYAVAVQGMDKQQPIMPDIYINESYSDFLNSKDIFIECALDQIRSEMNKKQNKNFPGYENKIKIRINDIMHQHRLVKQFFCSETKLYFLSKTL